MIRPDFKIEHGRALQTALENVSKRVRRKSVRDALLKVAAPMVAASERIVRRSPGAGVHLGDHLVLVPTGKRKDLPAPGAQAVTWGPARIGGGRSGDLYYAHFLEYGTVRTPPFPFLRPPFESGAGQAIVDLGEAIWAELRGRGGERPGGE